MIESPSVTDVDWGMAIMEKDLQASLAELKKEVEGLDSTDGESQERLQRIIKNLETKLDATDDEPEDGFMSYLEDSLTHFETSHPQVTSIINRVATALSNMGI